VRARERRREAVLRARRLRCERERGQKRAAYYIVRMYEKYFAPNGLYRGGRPLHIYALWLNAVTQIFAVLHFRLDKKIKLYNTRAHTHTRTHIVTQVRNGYYTAKTNRCKSNAKWILMPRRPVVGDDVHSGSSRSPRACACARAAEG